ncbi:MAG: dockerin type I domain-containing protein, partial [Planctomycetota bacterium]
VASEAATVAEGALVATEGSAITSTAGRALGGFILPELMVGITGVTLAGVAGFALGSAIVDAMPDVGSFWGDLAWDTWETVSESATRIVASWDPNDITGPSGVTEEHFQDSDTPLPYPYRIRFENLEEATAPAYQVVITQQLDESLDWSTFELVDFGFGNLQFEIPTGLSNYATRIDLRPELDLLLDFEAAINSSTGIASWTFTSLSADTLDIPIDPQLGFLPPNVISPQGQGYVNYRIHAKQGLDDGQRITEHASIVFDTNEAIETNVYRNAIDRELPASQVQALPAEVYQEDFTVSWSGDDFDGSGVLSWDIYVSIDESPYQLWLDDTQDQQGIFTGELGKQYRFISAASDYVGHVENLPEQHDAMTYLDPLPWQNSIASNDVDPNGFITPLDAFIVINDLNLNGARALPTPQSQPRTFLDPSGDNFVTPLDALLVIDHLNSVSGEGESSDSDFSLIGMPFGAYWFSELDDRERKRAEQISPEILDLLLANSF